MSGPNPRLRYDDQTIWMTARRGSHDLALKVVRLVWDQPRNSVKDSTSGSISAGWTITERLRMTANAEYSRTPDFTSDVRAMLFCRYRFDMSVPKTKSGAKEN